jgi:hypothetical protein
MENQVDTQDEQQVDLRNVGVRPGPSGPLDLDAPIDDLPMPEDEVETPDVDIANPGVDASEQI